MADERTYGFSKHDAEALTQSISNGEAIFPEIRPRGGGGGGGGEIMHFTIDAIDCNDSGDWAVTPTHYTGKCAEPPGADPYTGAYYVKPFCVSPFTQEQLETSGKGVATYTYNLQTCEQYWMEISHCAESGC